MDPLGPTPPGFVHPRSQVFTSALFATPLLEAPRDDGSGSRYSDTVQRRAWRFAGAAQH